MHGRIRVRGRIRKMLFVYDLSLMIRYDLHSPFLSFQQKIASFSTFRVLTHFTTAFTRERVVLEKDGRITEKDECGGEKERVGEVSTFWWLKTERRSRPREKRWSRQLRHYIPNRKRDKANKTLSGRRSANRTLGEERRDENWKEGGGREREGGGVAGTERTKTWNKSPHFCSLESFSNYGRNGKERMAVRGGPSVIYTLRRFRNY